MAVNDQYLIPGLFPFSRSCGNPAFLFVNRSMLMGAQKNSLNETVLLSTQNKMFKLANDHEKSYPQNVCSSRFMKRVKSMDLQYLLKNARASLASPRNAVRPSAIIKTLKQRTKKCIMHV